MKEKDIRRLAGRCILQGFDGTDLPPALAAEASDGALAGVVLFSRNVKSPAQVYALCSRLRHCFPADRRPIVAVDQEGGRVVRIRKPLTALPPAAVLGALDDVALTAQAGRLVGMELSALGITLNFAPVLDVNTHPASPVIGDRAFGTTPDSVIRHGLAFADGLLQGGVHPCAKHFPGHGDANVDSHVGLPVVSHSIERLRAVELPPFVAWAAQQKGPIMSAHVVYPALDPDRPATASHRILTTLLKAELGFSGVVLTDDLEMGAISAKGGAAAMAVDLLRAGADGLLICRSLELRTDVVNRLVTQALSDAAFHRRLEEAADRLGTLSRPLGPEVPFAFIESEAHRTAQAELNTRLRQRREP